MQPVQRTVAAQQSQYDYIRRWDERKVCIAQPVRLVTPVKAFYHLLPSAVRPGLAASYVAERLGWPNFQETLRRKSCPFEECFSIPLLKGPFLTASFILKSVKVAGVGC
jgi:hypothetical protein